MKWPWRKRKEPHAFTPQPETDYDGNDLWGIAFPKPRQLTQYESALFKYLNDNQMSYWDYMCQQANQQIYYRQNALSGLMGPIGGYL